MSEAEVKMVLPENAFEKLPEDEKNNEFIAMKSRSYFQHTYLVQKFKIHFHFLQCF